MNTKFHRLARQIAVALFVALCGLHARAAVIYFDDFSGTGSAPLNATAPDVRPGSQTWSAAADWRADGSVSRPFDGGFHAFLPFVPVSGNIYSLSMDAHVIDGADANNFISIGFSSTNNVATPYHPDGFVAFMFKRTDNYSSTDDVNTFLGPFAGDGAGHNFDVDGVLNMKVVLNTQASLWTVEWFLNNASIRGPVAYTANPTINYVTFGAFQNTDGTVDNFTLSAVPEPMSLSLWTGGAIGLLAFLRRR